MVVERGFVCFRRRCLRRSGGRQTGRLEPVWKSRSMRRRRQTDMQGLVLQKHGDTLWLVWTFLFEAVIVAS